MIDRYQRVLLEVQGAGDHEDRPDERAEGSHGRGTLGRYCRAVLSYLEAGPGGDARGTLLCLHGYPESAHMWGALVEAAAGAGWRALAPDLPGYGDSPPDPPHTWKRMVDAVERFHERARRRPRRAVRPRLGRAHRPALGLRPPREGARARHLRDRLLPRRQVARPGQGDAHRGRGRADRRRHDAPGASARCSPRVAPGIGEHAIDEYFKAYADPVRRRGQLELYRSGDFAELEPYRGRLAALGVPTLLLFGSEDPFARVATAHRLAQEIPHARTEMLDGIGHFMFDEVPERAAAIVVDFLRDGLTARLALDRRRLGRRSADTPLKAGGVTCR